MNKDRIDYIARALQELRTLAHAEDASLFAYLIEMAATEASDLLKPKRRQ